MRLFRLSEIKRGLKNLFLWLPIIWKDRQWDYIFLLRIILFKLQLMHKNLEAEQHKKRKIYICILLLQRLVKEEYENTLFDAYEKKWGNANFTSQPSFNLTYEKITTDKDKKQAKKEMIEVLKQAQYLQQQDLEYLCKLFQKHLFTWWD